MKVDSQITIINHSSLKFHVNKGYTGHRELQKTLQTFEHKTHSTYYVQWEG